MNTFVYVCFENHKIYNIVVRRGFWILNDLVRLNIDS